MTDKRELKPASENPWYVLMTVAGEHIGVGVDEEVHARNRRYWNGRAAEALSNEEKARLLENGRTTEEDLAPLSHEERAAITDALDARAPSEIVPEPTDRIRLSHTFFENKVCCDGFVFPEFVSFEASRFANVTSFRGADFVGSVEFSEVVFVEFAYFENSSFARDVSFHKVIFSDYSDFSSTYFVDGVYFKAAHFCEFANFQDATFSYVTEFQDTNFKSSTLFSRAKFLPPDADPPTFFNAVLHEDTDWTDVHWPEPPDTREGAIQHRRAYERLKLLMDSQNKFHDEHMFLRMELRCREIEEPNSWASWASRLFRWTSNYGWSIQRPSVALGITLALGWALIFIAEWSEHWFGSDEYLGLGQSFALSLSNVFGFLGFSRTFLSDEIKTLTAFSEVISATQTIVGLILFFLLGLALRNRFRIK